MKTVAMIGAGAWGTAMSTVLAHNGYHVKLWCYETTLAQTIIKTHENITFLPGVQLSENIHAVSSLEEALQDVDEIFFAVPVNYSRKVLEQCRPFYKKEQIWIFLNKGIEQETLLVPTQIVDQIFKASVIKAVVMGPSFAKDIVSKQLTGVVCAFEDVQVYEKIKKLLTNHYFRLSSSSDMIGVQLCAALKNVIALGVGILDGQECGDNTKIFFIMNILKEMEHIVVSCGGSAETVFGFAGIGDSMLTALCSKSRNLEVGKCLGQGQKLSDIINSFKGAPEGVNTSQSLSLLLQNKNIDAPFFDMVYKNLSKKINFLATVIF